MEKVTRAMPQALNSSKPAVRKLCVLILSFFVIGLVSGTVRAQGLKIKMSGVPSEVKEMGLVLASVSASGGEGPLTYSWSL